MATEEEIYLMLRERKNEQEAKKNPKAKKTSNSSKKKAAMSEAERREKIALGLARKRECEAKALKIVERLIEVDLNQEWFRDAGQFLTPERYDDIVTERAVEKLCGYALCKNELGPIKKQQFHISMKENKVYDLTERKNFCSNACFKASNFYKSQLSTEPLWLREKGSMPRINFIEETKLKRQSSGMGDEVEMVTEVKKSEIEDPGPSQVLDENIEHVSSENVIKIENEEEQIGQDKDQNFKNQSEQKFESMQIGDGQVKSEPKQVDPKAEEAINSKVCNKNVSFDMKKPQEPRDFKRRPEPRVRHLRPGDKLSPKEKVEKCFQEWYTIDSFRFLKGNGHVGQVLKDSGCTRSSILATLGDETLNPKFQSQYIKLCRNLDLLELAENKEADSEGQCNKGTAGAKKRPTNYVPEYELLKKEQDEVMNKVSAFMSGGKLPDPVISEKSVESEEIGPCIPLLDKHAQGALRRRVVHDQLERTMPDILKICHLAPRDVASSLRELIKTFTLNAENVVMNLNEWTCATIILLVMLCDQEPLLKKNISNESTMKNLNLILLAYETDLNSVKRFTSGLHGDVQGLVQKMARY